MVGPAVGGGYPAPGDQPLMLGPGGPMASPVSASQFGSPFPGVQYTPGQMAARTPGTMEMGHVQRRVGAEANMPLDTPLTDLFHRSLIGTATPAAFALFLGMLLFTVVWWGSNVGFLAIVVAFLLFAAACALRASAASKTGRQQDFGMFVLRLFMLTAAGQMLYASFTDSGMSQVLVLVPMVDLFTFGFCYHVTISAFVPDPVWSRVKSRFLGLLAIVGRRCSVLWIVAWLGDEIFLNMVLSFLMVFAMEVQTQALHVVMRRVLLENCDTSILEESVNHRTDSVERWLAMAHIKCAGKEVEVDTLGNTMVLVKNFTKHLVIIDVLKKQIKQGGSCKFEAESDRIEVTLSEEIGLLTLSISLLPNSRLHGKARLQEILKWLVGLSQIVDAVGPRMGKQFQADCTLLQAEVKSVLLQLLDAYSQSCVKLPQEYVTFLHQLQMNAGC